MDRQSRAIDIIKAYNEFKHSKNEPMFIKKVCLYFDMAKNNLLNEQDLQLLLFLANKVGIPQYFDMLQNKFNKNNLSLENINLLSLGSLINEASLYNDGIFLHKYQKQILEYFKPEKQNRFLLSAPTSFGKTYIVYEIIKKLKKYKNILLVFPSISLLSENYLKIKKYNFFKNYKIYTLSEEEFKENDYKIFIFTPERYLSFLDKKTNISFDFAFIDEMYKIDNGFMVDEKEAENERDIAYRIALENICNTSKDILLAGPYMGLPDNINSEKKSLIEFAKQNKFTFLQYNDFEIVDKQYYNIKTKQSYTIDGMNVNIGNISTKDKILKLINTFNSHNENTIIYCSSRAKTEEYAKYVSLNLKTTAIDNEIEIRYQLFIQHIENIFGSDWCVLKALKTRVGIHHGFVPKYIQKEIIHLFNNNVLCALFSTTTITEGVNTNAKNIIITSNKKGIKPLKQFDAKNIAGRAGRFLEHYVGRVIDLNNEFENIVNSSQEIIEHKNYDVNSQKDEVDYQITKKEYLSPKDKENLHNILLKIKQLQMPNLVFNSFKVISPTDKITLYLRIQNVSLFSDPVKRLNKCFNLYNMKRLDWDAFEQIMQIIYPIIKEKKLLETIDCKVGQGNYSLLTIILSSYLEGGFIEMVRYNTEKREFPLNKDKAIRRVADYVYNIFKYILVKYLGIFDLFYRYQISLKENIPDINNINGLGLLIKKLEYDALNADARKLSDYGVPFKLVQYYDSNDSSIELDNYEKIIYEETKSLIN